MENNVDAREVLSQVRPFQNNLMYTVRAFLLSDPGQGKQKDVKDIFNCIFAAGGQKTDSSLIGCPVTAESFTPVSA